MADCAVTACGSAALPIAYGAFAVSGFCSGAMPVAAFFPSAEIVGPTGCPVIASSMASALSNANLYGIEAEGKTAMMSNIMDADIGAEVVSLTKWQILSQSGTSALTNANQASQTVLGLLR